MLIASKCSVTFYFEATILSLGHFGNIFYEAIRWHQEAWRQTQHWLNYITFDYSWELIINELKNRHIRNKTYILDTMEHLISIGYGTMVGFKVLDTSELTMPSKVIQDAYINIYGIKYYYPLIMGPAMLNSKKSKDFLYYSMQYPTLCKKPPNFSSFPSVLSILRDLKDTTDAFIGLAKQWPENKENEIIDFLTHIEFGYFHTEKDKYNQISNIDTIFKDDNTFKLSDDLYGPRIIPDTAHFFRGCVRIGYHKPSLTS